MVWSRNARWDGGFSPPFPRGSGRASDRRGGPSRKHCCWSCCCCWQRVAMTCSAVRPVPQPALPCRVAENGRGHGPVGGCVQAGSLAVGHLYARCRFRGGGGGGGDARRALLVALVTRLQKKTTIHTQHAPTGVSAATPRTCMAVTLAATWCMSDMRRREAELACRPAWRCEWIASLLGGRSGQGRQGGGAAHQVAVAASRARERHTERGVTARSRSHSSAQPSSAPRTIDLPTTMPQPWPPTSC